MSSSSKNPQSKIFDNSMSNLANNPIFENNLTLGDSVNYDTSRSN